MSDMFVGKTIAITGAAGGIGQVLCRFFGEEGATIAALDRSDKVHALAESLGKDGVTVKTAVADLADPASVKAAFADFGDVHILINNAGISRHATLATTDPEGWGEDIDANLNGAHAAAHAVLPQMVERRAGNIVTVGSVKVLGALTPLSSLTDTLGAVTDTLSSVLESVAGVSFTAPKLTIGQPTHSTKTTGTTRFATASITGVKLTLPSLTLPNALALPGVPTGVSGSLTFGQLSETAQWTPGTAATPSTPQTPSSSPQGSPLPDTGGRMLLPVAGLLILGSAVLLWRRTRLSAPTNDA